MTDKISSNDQDQPVWLSSELALILLLPDIMVQDAWTDLFNRLDALDIELIAITPIRLTPQRLARIYRSHRLNAAKEGRLDATWVAPALMEMDMSIAVLVGSKGAHDLCAELDYIKGPSPWWLRTADHLRAVSALSHRGMSLFHTPTDQADFERTTKLFFLPNTLNAIRTNGADRSLEWDDLRHLRGYTPADRDQHPLAVVLRVVSRAITLLAVDIHIEPNENYRELACRVRFVEQLLCDTPLANQRNVFEEDLSRLAQSLDEIGPPIIRALPSEQNELDSFSCCLLGQNRHALYCLLRLLLRPDTFGATLYDHARDVLFCNDLYLSHWELHQLTTSIVFYSETG